MLAEAANIASPCAYQRRGFLFFGISYTELSNSKYRLGFIFLKVYFRTKTIRGLFCVKSPTAYLFSLSPVYKISSFSVGVKILKGNLESPKLTLFYDRRMVYKLFISPTITLKSES